MQGWTPVARKKWGRGLSAAGAICTCREAGLVRACVYELDQTSHARPCMY